MSDKSKGTIIYSRILCLAGTGRCEDLETCANVTLPTLKKCHVSAPDVNGFTFVSVQDLGIALLQDD